MRGQDRDALEGEMSEELHKFGPRPKGALGSLACPACHQPFKEGDFTTLITLGPGDDPEEQEKARVGRPYCAVAVEVHWVCATGEQP